MEFYPLKEEFNTLSKAYVQVPVMAEIMADMVTPVNLFARMKAMNKGSFLLESADNGEHFGRYSFIGLQPEIIIIYKEGILSIWENGQETKIETLEPFKYIEALSKRYQSPKLDAMPGFTGGIIGYFGYDIVRLFETTVNLCPPDDLDIADIYLIGVQDLIVFDHFKHRLLLITNVKTQEEKDHSYEKATEKLRKLYEELLMGDVSFSMKEAPKELSVSQLLTKEEFVENVEKAKKHIYEGDIFQVVLSQRFEVKNPPNPFNVYRMLRAGNPSPYMYYMEFDDVVVVGSSPEMLVNVANGIVSTNPIAGTTKRGRDAKEDQILEAALLADKKELAEHTMLVDLGRNDIGRISKFGSVHVNRFMEIEKYAHVMHIVSNVTGELTGDLSPLDALKSILPAGTLSGAPKVRAMQIIDDLEKRKRGLYGGAIGYLSFNGTLDTCIAIRTALFKGDTAYIQAGSGIVADSSGEKEYQEVMAKASALLTAFEKAGDLS